MEICNKIRGEQVDVFSHNGSLIVHRRKRKTRVTELVAGSLLATSLALSLLLWLDFQVLDSWSGFLTLSYLVLTILSVVFSVAIIAGVSSPYVTEIKKDIPIDSDTGVEGYRQTHDAPTIRIDGRQLPYDEIVDVIISERKNVATERRGRHTSARTVPLYSVWLVSYRGVTVIDVTQRQDLASAIATQIARALRLELAPAKKSPNPPPDGKLPWLADLLIATWVCVSFVAVFSSTSYLGPGLGHFMVMVGLVAYLVCARSFLGWITSRRARAVGFDPTPREATRVRAARAANQRSGGRVDVD